MKIDSSLFMSATRDSLTATTYLFPNTMLITRDPILYNSTFAPTPISQHSRYANSRSPRFFVSLLAQVLFSSFHSIFLHAFRYQIDYLSIVSVSIIARIQSFFKSTCFIYFLLAIIINQISYSSLERNIRRAALSICVTFVCVFLSVEADK